MGKRFFLTVLIIGVLLSFSCEQAMEDAPIVIATVSSDGFIDSIQVIVFKSDMMTPVMDADVSVNGVSCEPIFFGMYAPSDLSGFNFSEGSSYSLSVNYGGQSISGTVTMPEAPINTNSANFPGPLNAAAATNVSYSFTDIPDSISLSVSALDTDNREVYSTGEAANASGTLTIPANTLAPSNTFGVIELGGMNIGSLNGGALGSLFAAMATISIDFDTN
jgi:hypothetical protein